MVVVSIMPAMPNLLLTRTTVCIPTDEGADTSCNQRTYVHYDGDGKAQSCSKDRTAPFNGDFCSTYGTIQTPDGPGNFEATSSCSAPHDGTGGAIQGYVTPAKSGTWKYACVNNKAAAAYNCYGEEYACTYIYYCARVDAGVQH